MFYPQTKFSNETQIRLSKSILFRIHRYEIRRLRIRFGLNMTLVLCAALAFIPTMQFLRDSAIQSGFSDYVSLFSTDSSFVLSHLNEVIMPIADSLPITGTVISLGLLLILIYSLRGILSNRSSLQNINITSLQTA